MLLITVSIFLLPIRDTLPLRKIKAVPPCTSLDALPTWMHSWRVEPCMAISFQHARVTGPVCPYPFHLLWLSNQEVNIHLRSSDHFWHGTNEYGTSTTAGALFACPAPLPSQPCTGLDLPFEWTLYTVMILPWRPN